MEMNSYGVTKKVSHSDPDGLYLEELSINGFTIIPDILGESVLNECRQRLDEVYTIQEKKSGKKFLEEINELNLARCPLAYDDFFLFEVASHIKILSLIKKILGDYFILHLQNGIINMPGMKHHQSSWHRDLPYQNFIINKPLAIGCLFCIDHFTEENGCTYVLPFSHQRDFIPSDEYIQKFRQPAKAEAGSVIMFDAMLFHAAGYNASNSVRRGINHVYAAPILKQQINLPQFLKGKYSDHPVYSRLLGYENIEPGSVDEYRAKRKHKKQIK